MNNNDTLTAWDDDMSGCRVGYAGYDRLRLPFLDRRCQMPQSKSTDVPLLAYQHT